MASPLPCVLIDGCPCRHVPVSPLSQSGRPSAVVLDRTGCCHSRQPRLPKRVFGFMAPHPGSPTKRQWRVGENPRCCYGLYSQRPVGNPVFTHAMVARGNTVTAPCGIELGSNDSVVVQGLSFRALTQPPNQRMKLSWRGGRVKGNGLILIAAAAPRSLCAIR